MKIKQLFKNKPLVVAIISGLVLVGVLSGLEVSHQQNKHEALKRAGLQTLFANSKEQRLNIAASNARSAQRLLGYGATKAWDDDPPPEMCEFFGEIVTYWYEVSRGLHENPLLELVELLDEAIANGDYEEAAELLGLFDVGEISMFDENLDGELDESEIEAARDMIANATPRDMFEALVEGFEEMCPQQYVNWFSGMGWGSGSGMGSGSY